MPVGVQSPRLSRVPDFISSSGREAVELAASAGLHLDPWQQLVLDGALGETQQGKWSAFHVALVVPRQNGKGSILEALELAGLFLFEERLIIHSAHEQATASEHFMRMLELIEGCPDLSRQCMKPVHGKGSEAIRLKNGQRIFFKTRTAGGGRGLSGDKVILDEAMMLTDRQMNALLSTMAAKSKHGNPQLWYTGSPVDKHDSQQDGVPFARVRANALAGKPRHALFEWGAAAEDPDQVTDEMSADPVVWAQGNPGLSIRITHEFVEDERSGLSARGFAIERLGVGDWPDPNPAAEGWGDISKEAWAAILDPHSVAQDPLVLSVAVAVDRSASAICAAGSRADGLRQVGVIDHRPGTGWVVDRVAELVEIREPVEVVVDGKGPAASLVEDLKAKGVKVHVIGLQEHAEGCALLVDAIEQRTVRHLGTTELSNAARGAVKRTVGDVWLWGRRASAVDVSPLEGVTLAFWGSVRSVAAEPLVAWR